MFADPPKPVLDVVSDAFTPVAQDQQHVGGLLAARLRANTEGFLERINQKELFAEPATAGLFLIAGSNSYAYTGDVQLRSVMDRVARALAKTELSGGEQNVTDSSENAALLAGLLAYATETGDDEAFAAARKLANSTLKKATGLTAEASAVLIGPMLDLYRETGDRRYLEFCDRAAHSKFELPATGLEALRIAGGLLDYYTHSGDESFLKRAITVWNAQHVSITGAPADETASTLCATVAWFRLTLDLFRITGQAQYADNLERTIYNQLLAAQEPATGHIYDSESPNGLKQVLVKPVPCALAEAVGLSQIPDAIWGRLGNSIALLTYPPARANIRLRRRNTVQIYMEGNYPETGDVLVHVEPNRETRFSLRLRVPSWARKFAVEVGETRLMGKPGEFVTVSRQWKKGDTVKISIELTTETHTDPTRPDVIAFQRGPQVLVLDRSLNPSLTDLGSISLAPKAAASVTPLAQDTRMPFSAMSERAFQVAGQYAGKQEKLTLVPFADARSYALWLPMRANP